MHVLTSQTFARDSPGPRPVSGVWGLVCPGAEQRTVEMPRDERRPDL